VGFGALAGARNSPEPAKALCGAVAELASTSTKHPQKIQKWVSPTKKGGNGYGNKEVTAGDPPI
jgi:hypothetical protein